MGPPGKSGQEGGLGPLGSAGPRGMTMQGKMVGRPPRFLCTVVVIMINVLINISAGLDISFYICPFRVLPVQEGKREILGGQESRSV